MADLKNDWGTGDPYTHEDAGDVADAVPAETPSAPVKRALPRKFPFQLRQESS